jgi:hypothetical protein
MWNRNSAGAGNVIQFTWLRRVYLRGAGSLAGTILCGARRARPHAVDRGRRHSPEQPPGNRPNNHPYAQKRDWSPGPNRDYLGDLQRPDNHLNRYRDKNSQSCCDAGDTVETKFKVEPGDGPHPEDRWYAWLNGEWIAVPPEKNVTDRRRRRS